MMLRTAAFARYPEPCSTLIIAADTALRECFVLLPPPKGTGYVFTYCLFVCQPHYSKIYKRISMKFLKVWGVARGPVS